MSKPDNDTRKRIIKVAVRLIKERGYDDVTVNDVCSGSSVSKHTFYYYFKSKDDILSAFNDIPREIKAEELVGIINAENSFEKLWLTISSFLDSFIDMGPEIVKRIMIMNFVGSVETFSKPADSEHLKLQLSLIGKAQEEGIIGNTSQPEMLFHAFHSTLIGILLFWIRKEGYFDLKEYVRACMEIIMFLPVDKRKSNADLSVWHTCTKAQNR